MCLLSVTESFSICVVSEVADIDLCSALRPTGFAVETAGSRSLEGTVAGNSVQEFILRHSQVALSSSQNILMISHPCSSIASILASSLI
jgi:hypothetical protein